MLIFFYLFVPHLTIKMSDSLAVYVYIFPLNKLSHGQVSVSRVNNPQSLDTYRWLWTEVSGWPAFDFLHKADIVVSGRHL